MIPGTVTILLKMKNTLFALTLLSVLVSCTQSNTSQTDKIKDVVFEVPELLAVAMDSLDKKIQISGLVTHVCSHSGRRCFIEDTTGEHSIKIEASETLGQFSRELMGQQITVTGVVKENRLTAEYINEWETEVNEKSIAEAENEGESCASELANIESMRKWMKEHGTDYYSIFYIEGLSYTDNQTEAVH